MAKAAACLLMAENPVQLFNYLVARCEQHRPVLQMGSRFGVWGSEIRGEKQSEAEDVGCAARRRRSSSSRSRRGLFAIRNTQWCANNEVEESSSRRRRRRRSSST
jgi:hypothetical protein